MYAFLFSDLHVNYKQLKNIENLLISPPKVGGARGGMNNDINLLIFAGDLVNMGEPVGYVEQFLRVLAKVNKPFLWVPGNNDFGRAYYKLAAKYPSLEGKVVEFPPFKIERVEGGMDDPSPKVGEARWGMNNLAMKQYSNEPLRFTGVGGSPASWAGQYAGESMIDKKLIGGSIFVSHVPPPGVYNWQKLDEFSPPKVGGAGGGMNKNSKKLSDAPLVHICGHIHHQWGTAYLGKTKIIKLAAMELGYYAILDLETMGVEFTRFN